MSLRLVAYTFMVMLESIQQHRISETDAPPSSRAVDARVKVVLLVAYAVALFCVSSWQGLALAACVFVVAYALSGVGAKRVFLLAVPLYAMVAFMLIGSSLVYLDYGGREIIGFVHVVDDFYIRESGLAHGLIFGTRIILVVWMSFVVGFSTTSSELVDALNRFMMPLERMGVRTADAATIITIAVRFFPLMVEEFKQVRNAQWSRGGIDGSSGLIAKIKSWGVVLMPMMAGLFRRSDALGDAMESRCYGAPHKRTMLNELPMSTFSKALLAGGLLFCLMLGIVF